MTTFTLRPADECTYDVVALGEIMLRLDPGEGRIRTARSFTPWEGGGEYNVARGLASVFGRRAAVVTALTDNEVGHLVASLIRSGGVDTTHVRWRPFDGLGLASRNGLNFTERGFGVRGALGVSDRAGTAASQMRPGDVDWDHLFGDLGVRWFHTGGVFAALSSTTAATVLEAVAAAQRHGTVVSYDLNYRPSLWSHRGGCGAAAVLNQEIAPHVNVLIGNEGHFGAVLGTSPDYGPGGPVDFEEVVAGAVSAFPSLQVLAATSRTVRSASSNGWAAQAWSRDTGSVVATPYDLDVLDRVGGGDSFVAGLAAALLDGRELRTAVQIGVAHGALAMTTPGDVSMATQAEVLALASGTNASARR